MAQNLIDGLKVKSILELPALEEMMKENAGCTDRTCLVVAEIGSIYVRILLIIADESNPSAWARWKLQAGAITREFDKFDSMIRFMIATLGPVEFEE